MKYIFIILLTLCGLQCYSQSKTEYLENNRYDLNDGNFDFPQKDFSILGFGAYHGSAKTEDVEIALLKSLTKSSTVKYYLPETDFSTAYYFNEFLEKGDTLLLRDLVTYYGISVNQERTIQVYQKWKQLKEINDRLPDSAKLRVIGVDIINNLKYVSMHISELVSNSGDKLAAVSEIRNMIKTDTATYNGKNSAYASTRLKNLVTDYEHSKNLYRDHITNIAEFEHIIRNLKIVFGLLEEEREQLLYHNYINLDSIYDFKHHPQFIRIGFFHLEKSREGKKGYPSFFTRLLENHIYGKEEVISVIGYLTNSRVIWDELYDDNGNYTGYTVEEGMGIGDYEKEYFRGIQNLKDAKISDKTLFRLNKNDSPYTNPEPDLIEVIMPGKESNGEHVKGMATTDFLDYAVLISDSPESIPIFEME